MQNNFIRLKSRFFLNLIWTFVAESKFILFIAQFFATLVLNLSLIIV